MPYTEIATATSKDKQAYIYDLEYEFSPLPRPWVLLQQTHLTDLYQMSLEI